MIEQLIFLPPMLLLLLLYFSHPSPCFANSVTFSLSVFSALEPRATLQSWFKSCQFSKAKKHKASWIQLLITGWVVRIFEPQQMMMKGKIIFKIQVEAKMFQVNVLYLRNRNQETDIKTSWETPCYTFFFVSFYSLSLKSQLCRVSWWLSIHTGFLSESLDMHK